MWDESVCLCGGVVYISLVKVNEHLNVVKIKTKIDIFLLNETEAASITAAHIFPFKW